MNPGQPPNSNSAEINKLGLFRRQLEPMFKQQNAKWLGLLGLAFLGVAIYWDFTYSGPYRHLAEWQLKWFGFYSPKLTVLVIFGGFFVGFWAIATVIKFLLRGAERPVPQLQTAAVATTGVVPRAVRASAPPAADRWMQSVRLGVMYLTPFVVVGLGAHSYYNGMHEGNLQQLTVADFENGRVTARALYADVRGDLSDTYLSNDSYRYIPVLSKEKAARPFTLLVGISDGDVLKYLHRGSDGTFSVRGVAEKGLPSDLRYAFDRYGIALADPVWVVHAGRDPARDRQTGLLIMGFGVVLAGFLFGWQAYQKRKSAAPRGVPAPNLG